MTEVPAVFALTVSLVILASIWAWVFAFGKLFARQPLLAFEPRNTPRWSLLEIFITVMLMFTLQGLAGVVLGMVDPPPDDAAPIGTTAVQDVEPQKAPAADLGAASLMIVVGGVGSVIACGLGGLLIVMRTGSSWGGDLGLTMRQAGRDVSYGVVAYVMLAPIIGAIQALMQNWYPSEHPLIESFRAHPTLEFYLVCVFAAAIVAPTVEEFVCRVLVQGWLERVFAAKSLKHALFPESAGDELSLPATQAFHPVAREPAMEMSAEVDALPNDGQHDQLPSPLPRPLPSGMPIIISALLFAVMHWGHGPDPIPLFVLALGLGYLYQRTHRILPCVVLHFLVNAFSLAVLALSLVAE